MTVAVRKIVEIDEAKCDGCGACIPSCAEGALAIVDGKARIVKDMFCDGLGACLGECPRGALKIIERTAEAFDEHAAMEHVRQTREVSETPAAHAPAGAAHGPLGCGCPGSAMQTFAPAPGAGRASGLQGQDAGGSELSHWPVQLRLIPPHAPFLKGADLLLAADCVAVAHPQFHQQLLQGRKVLIGCPKFDDAQDYVRRLTDILVQAAPRSITVARMEVPCCASLTAIAHAAVRAAASSTGTVVPLEEVIIGRQGAAVAAPLAHSPGAPLLRALG